MIFRLSTFHVEKQIKGGIETSMNKNKRTKIRLSSKEPKLKTQWIG